MVLTQTGVAHVFSEPSGAHTIDFWRTYEGSGLAWLLQHIGS